MLLSPLSVSGLSRAGRGSGPHDVRAGIEVVATMILSHQWPVEGVASARCACGVQFGRPPGGTFGSARTLGRLATGRHWTS